MTDPIRRTIRAGGLAARRELAALLESIWAAEAIRPGSQLVVAAHVLADSPALDNNAGGFSGLEPAWGERTLRLSDLVLRILTQGSEVSLLTLARSDGPNSFLNRVQKRAAECGRDERLRTRTVAQLPARGVLGNGYSLIGQIDFTDAGPAFAGESVVYAVGPPDNERREALAALNGLFS